MKEKVYFKVPRRILVTLYRNKEMYGLELKKKTNVTPSHVIDILQELEEIDLIEREKNSRKVMNTLTEKGERIAEHLNEIDKILDEG
ncbi:hypothetical protein AKJ56_00345 [candidate division MSBL1 archaeon SCGC-AAA382N08]|uniref:HTH marR-type domain-containing protein n=1 Tax=candidate division MSBL1 archaeon SCGC-AAA382N08 TaxID=1698285 RepID=A0A133VQR7_9EURY|nr:hypothetical protein AKJ56_00345 [candidate division MSBL1 archaeon SCGC-AAA382N08]